MRRLLPLLLLFLFSAAPAASAQLLKIEFATEKDAKKFEKYTTLISGQPRLICESRDDSITLDSALKQWVFKGSRIEVWIGDSADPTLVPYKFSKGELVPTNKKWLLGIARDRIKSVQWFDSNQTFAGLSKEYAIRQSIIAETEADRDACDKGTAEWFRNHMRLVGANKRLLSWLRNTCYDKAADKLEKDVKKQEKIIAKEAQDYRLRAALESIEMVETPENLTEASQKITEGSAKFKVQESQHVRIVYVDELEDAQIRGLLELAETAIDGFKIEFVDPYLDIVDFRDTIPDRIFQEFFFGPTEHKRSYEMFLIEFYGLQWGKNKEKMLEGSGSIHGLSAPARELSYSMLKEDNDLEGRITHSIGHTLARHHYQNGSSTDQMAWLREAVGYYISFEMLGRNSLTCFQWRDEEAQRYRKPKKEELEEGKKDVVLGMRDAFNAMALEEGPKIDALSLKTLFELGNADFAKGWSFYDYVARKMGKKGQMWLRVGCKAALKKSTMINDWRTASEELYEVQGQDIFKKLDDEWRTFAETEQDTSGQ